MTYFIAFHCGERPCLPGAQVPRASIWSKDSELRHTAVDHKYRPCSGTHVHTDTQAHARIFANSQCPFLNGSGLLLVFHVFVHLLFVASVRRDTTRHITEVARHISDLLRRFCVGFASALALVDIPKPESSIVINVIQVRYATNLFLVTRQVRYSMVHTWNPAAGGWHCGECDA